MVTIDLMIDIIIIFGRRSSRIGHVFCLVPKYRRDKFQSAKRLLREKTANVK